jgi:hypothetical protein
VSFFTERTIKATRKVHRCQGCGVVIPIGSEAYYFSMKGEDGVWSGHYHPDCREAEKRLNDMLGWQGDDDWCLLHDADTEERDVLRKEFPAVYARWDEARAEHSPEQVQP